MLETNDQPKAARTGSGSLLAVSIFSLGITAATLISTFGPESKEIGRAREQVAEHQTILKVHKELLAQNEATVRQLEAMFSPPSATLALSPERALGDTISITLEVQDPDGDFAFANLWVFTPRRGWITVKFDNTQTVSGSLNEAAATTATVGVHVRKFKLEDGAGNYQFALAAVDRTGRRGDAPTLRVMITEPRSGSRVGPSRQAQSSPRLYAGKFPGHPMLTEGFPHPPDGVPRFDRPLRFVVAADRQLLIFPSVGPTLFP